MVVALGGDGWMLHAGRITAEAGVPVLGVNLGRLGFLAEVQPAEWRSVFDRVCAGDYWIEQRMMLHTEVWRGDQHLQSFDVLNEVVVSRGAVVRAVRLETHIDGGWLTTYVADGLIIATPTGSTAYALAVGGPILPPDLKNILLIPVAPHLSMERAIVLARGSTVTIIVHTEHRGRDQRRWRDRASAGRRRSDHHRSRAAQRALCPHAGPELFLSHADGTHGQESGRGDDEKS